MTANCSSRTAWTTTKPRAMQRLLLLPPASLLALALMSGGLGGCATDASVKSLAAASNSRLLAKPAYFVNDPRVQSYVNTLATEVLDAARRYHEVDPKRDDTWVYDKFEARIVLDDNMNAFVTGDDIVYINSGLIGQLEHPDQLLAIMTHELGHNELRHLKNNIDSKTTNVVLGLAAIGAGMAGGRVGRGVAVGAGGGAVLNNSLNGSFNRNEELQADARGLSLYMKMGYDPAHFQRVFEILKAKYGDGGVFSSHPRNSERIKQIADLAKDAQPSARSHSTQAFTQIQALVKAAEGHHKGTPPLADPKMRSNLMSCFDYCLVKPRR